VVEDFLSTLVARGFTDDGAVAAYRAFSSFLLGHLLLEVSAQGADVGPVAQADPDDKPTTDLSQYPRLKALEAELSQDHSAAEIRRSTGNPAGPHRSARAPPGQDGTTMKTDHSDPRLLGDPFDSATQLPGRT
jgi:hypothetical protein